MTTRITYDSLTEWEGLLDDEGRARLASQRTSRGPAPHVHCEDDKLIFAASLLASQDRAERGLPALTDEEAYKLAPYVTQVHRGNDERART
jgi:hypothetical protein